MATCKKCDQPIEWKRTADGWRPYNGEAPHRCARKPEVSEGILVVGDRYVPSCGQCAVPPWEVCPCSALMPTR